MKIEGHITEILTKFCLENVNDSWYQHFDAICMKPYEVIDIFAENSASISALPPQTC